MKTTNQNPADGELSLLLRQTRPAPGLPPRFQENVWQRIERADVVPVTPNWLNALAAWVVKPRFALAVATALVLAGVVFGSLEGASQARHEAQERYLAAVAMP